jgi:glycosyltransferase involved in cell wall biosynthesis
MNTHVSIVIPTYNRSEIVQRCVASCLNQTAPADVIVVDDCSTDETVAALRKQYGERITVLSHPQNRGINPSRYTGVAAVESGWVILLDSDWTLEPHAVERLRAAIESRPQTVRAVRSRVRWDTGRVSPSFMPLGVVGYEERMEWVEEEGGFDSLLCMERAAFDVVPLMKDRRGTVEELYELELAHKVDSLYLEDVLGKQHLDAGNSYLRSIDKKVLIPQLLGDAHDLLWMAETALERHGAALAQRGPNQLAAIEKIALAKSFLVGDRRKGLRFARRVLGCNPRDWDSWMTTIAGLAGPRVLAYSILTYRSVAAAITTLTRRAWDPSAQ